MADLTRDGLLRRPPSSDGLRVGSALALLVHLALVGALAWGVHWKRSEVPSVTAELWSAVPQLADAPAPLTPPVSPRTLPPPPPLDKPPRPAPAPVPKAVATPAQRDADIAVDKARKALAEAKQEDAARLAREREKEKEKEKEREQEKARKAQARAQAERLEQQEKDRLKADKLKAEKEAAKEAVKEAARKEAAAREAKDAKAEAARAKALRDDNLKRLNDQLGGGPGGNGTGQSADGGGGKAARSAAPSAGYGGRIVARVLPNIVFTGDTASNPTALVEVRLSASGQILSSRVLKSSGVPAWDQAVLRALERTEVLPPDVDGRVPASIEISFSPNRR